MAYEWDLPYVNSSFGSRCPTSPNALTEHDLEGLIIICVIPQLNTVNRSHAWIVVSESKFWSLDQDLQCEVLGRLLRKKLRFVARNLGTIHLGCGIPILDLFLCGLGLRVFFWSLFSGFAGSNLWGYLK
mmetsp:Transcript_28343/g.44214  ORF Transcript_28343/g.44214 Transcript_28343/m.44214 type:complete len:129 (+) Transcript_28343:213-599(+)